MVRRRWSRGNRWRAIQNKTANSYVPGCWDMRIDILQPCFRFVAVPRFCSKRRSNELLIALSLPPRRRRSFISPAAFSVNVTATVRDNAPSPLRISPTISDQPGPSSFQSLPLPQRKTSLRIPSGSESHIRVCEISHFQTHGFVSSSASKLTQRSQGWSAKRPSHRPRACRREMELNFRMFFIEYCNSFRLKLISVVQFGLDEIAKPVALQIEMNVGIRIES